VLPLGEDGLRRAISRPAEKTGVHVEAALVERLVAHAAGQPGAVPLVQEALVYRGGELRGRFVGLAEYEALGRQAGPHEEKISGLQVAMARHRRRCAERTFARTAGDRAAGVPAADPVRRQWA